MEKIAVLTWVEHESDSLYPDGIKTSHYSPVVAFANEDLAIQYLSELTKEIIKIKGESKPEIWLNHIKKWSESKIGPNSVISFLSIVSAKYIEKAISEHFVIDPFILVKELR